MLPPTNCVFLKSGAPETPDLFEPEYLSPPRRALSLAHSQPRFWSKVPVISSQYSHKFSKQIFLVCTPHGRLLIILNAHDSLLLSPDERTLLANLNAGE